MSIIMNIVGEYYIRNGQIKPSNEFDENYELDTTKHLFVYEIIRVIDSVPLFLEDHVGRLDSSLHLINKKLSIDIERIRKDIRKLIFKNNLINSNIKINISFKGEQCEIIIHNNKHYYPMEYEVQNGVLVGLLKYERLNPNAKILNSTYTKNIKNIMEETGVFEVLLIDGCNYITEGSRSNAFFVKEGMVYTAPGDKVLKGITRNYIIDICASLGITLIEERVSIDELSAIDAAFLTGTSIKILPIAKIMGNSLSSSSNLIVNSILNKYNKILKEYMVRQAVRE